MPTSPELVHDDGVAAPMILREDAVQQGGLPRSKIAREHGDRDCAWRRPTAAGVRVAAKRGRWFRHWDIILSAAWK